MKLNIVTEDFRIVPIDADKVNVHGIDYGIYKEEGKIKAFDLRNGLVFTSCPGEEIDSIIYAIEESVAFSMVEIKYSTNEAKLKEQNISLPVNK